MFSRIGSALQAAADVVAPPCARVEDLRYHWSQVVGACQRCQGPNPYADPSGLADNPITELQDSTALPAGRQESSNSNSRGGSVAGSSSTVANGSLKYSSTVGGVCNMRAGMVPAVEETHAPRHLAHMLKILTCEERDAWGSLSPCLEFLVTERVLASLASFAWCDRPLGVRQHAYLFLTGVLNHLNHNHLHHARIHKPLQSMVRASCDMTASPYEAQEIEYLIALCEKIRQDHSLVLLYIQPTAMSGDGGTPGHFTPNSDGCCTPIPAAPQLSEGSSCSLPPSLLGTSSAPPSLSPPHSLSGDVQRIVEASSLEESNSIKCISNDTNLSSDPPAAEGKNCCTDAVEGTTDDVSLPTPADDKFQHIRKSSIHSISSVHSSDSSTERCSSSSVSSAPMSLSCSSWTLTRSSSRHVGLQSSFPLVDALLNLCHSADCSISSAAHDGLLLLCGVREQICCKTIARHTLFTHYVAGRIAECIASVPKDVDPVLVEELTLPKEKPMSYTERAVAAAATPDISSSDSEDNDSTATEEAEEDFQGRRDLMKMLHWLAYCDKIVCAGDSVLSSSLCHCLREMVLDGELRPGLSSPDSDVVCYTLALVSRLLSALSSHSLVMCVVRWLCCCSTEAGYEESPVLPVLLAHCRQGPHQIQVLRLLQAAIDSSRGGGAALLAGAWLQHRGYFDSSAAEVQQNCWSDEEDERARQKDVTAELLSPGSQPISRTFAPNNINRIVKRFLCLVPEELQSNGSDDFESYKTDAVRQYHDMQRISSLHHWGREATAHPLLPAGHEGGGGSIADTGSLGSRDSPPEDDRPASFSPGPFLDTMLDLLDNLPYQDYDVNLQVTSVISCLSLLPHPHLHEFLLNPSLPLVEGTRTPYTVLRAVLARLSPAILGAPDYRQHLKLARHQLLGAVNTWELERDDQDRQFEALIVVEEFCKELAAIAHAKYTVEVQG